MISLFACAVLRGIICSPDHVGYKVTAERSARRSR